MFTQNRIDVIYSKRSSNLAEEKVRILEDSPGSLECSATSNNGTTRKFIPLNVTGNYH